MNYCKINTAQQAQQMPNPFAATIANPNETQKEKLAEIFDWLPMVYTDAPEYDPETQYVVDHWEEIDGKAVQKWEVHELPAPVPTIEDRVDNLEQNVADLVNGTTESGE